MSVQDSYDRWSETYDMGENFTRDLDQTVTKSILSGFTCNTLLEIGCGTGKNTIFLSKIAQKVYALDFSPMMIVKAKSRIQTENVLFCLADLTKKWVIVDRSIDIVVCNLVLEHIENLRFIFHQVTRVLGKGGRFLVSELHPFKQYQGIKANFQQEGEVTEVQAFIHHISDYLDAANENGLLLLKLNEWWHKNDHNKPPRLVTFLFEKSVNSP